MIKEYVLTGLGKSLALFSYRFITMILINNIVSIGSIFLLSFLSACAGAVEVKTSQLAFARETTLVSTITNQHYRVQWATIGDMPKEGYPVLYLLDGDMSFPIASIAAQTLMVNKVAKRNAPVLIVGIGYSQDDLLSLDRRAKDYTPLLRVETENSAKSSYGGADFFHQFIQKDLSPFLKKQVKINSQQQAIFGHSFGGLWASYNLLRYTAFQYYIISSPSLWWDKGRVFDFLPFIQNRQIDAKIKLSLGELEVSKDANDIRRQERDMKGNLEHFANKLQQRKIDVVLNVYPDENHGSAMYKALLEGLKFLQIHWQQ